MAFRVGALGESVGSQEGELGAEGFAKRLRQFKRANSLELAADGFALRCHSRAESSQFGFEVIGGHARTAREPVCGSIRSYSAVACSSPSATCLAISASR